MFRRGTLADTVPELKHCVVRASSISLPPLSRQLFEEVGGTDALPGVKQLFDEVGLQPLQQLQRFVPLLKCKARVWLQAIGYKSITLGHAIVTSSKAVADARVKGRRTGVSQEEDRSSSGGTKKGNSSSNGSSSDEAVSPDDEEIELGIGFATLVALDKDGHTMPIPQHQRLLSLTRPRSHRHGSYVVWPADGDSSVQRKAVDTTIPSAAVVAIREAAAAADRPPWLELLHQVI
jgi:hypothetical protein